MRITWALVAAVIVVNVIGEIVLSNIDARTAPSRMAGLGERIYQQTTGIVILAVAAWATSQ